MFHVWHVILSVPCSIVVTCWERAELLALLCGMFSCVFVTFPYGVLGQVWYLIVSIPDRCLLPYFVIYRSSKSPWPLFLGEGGPGHFHCMNFFIIHVPVVKPSFISFYNTSESLLDWRCTLPEDVDLTQLFADDLACSGFRQILLTCLIFMDYRVNTSIRNATF